MSDCWPIRKLVRAIAFGRHIPPAKLARRVELDLRRRIRDKLGAAPKGALGILRTTSPPLPLFPPRSGLVSHLNGAIALTFLNRTVVMRESVIDWSAPGSGAENQLWRMNLHYMEYLEAVTDAELGVLIDQWIKANPQARPGAWRDSWNSYALSLRVVIWMQELTRRSGRLPPGVVQRTTASLAEQLRFLESNLETDIGGNHLVKNIKALVWGSAFFAGVEAERWRGLGLGLLAEELPRQVLPDGMHFERSPSYHCQVLADLLSCRHALGYDPLGGALDHALARMAQVMADLTHPDHDVALLNDAGLSMAYGPDECLDVYERLFGRRPAPRRVFALREAGYFGMRAGVTYFVADCGRIAPDDLPAHGHGDVLSFEWSVGGERIVVDQGVYEYNAGARRQHSRAALNHNTLCLDDADQADFFGSFRCGRRPNVEVLAYEQTTDGFLLEGMHDGFRHLRGSPVHVRRFAVSSRKVVIRDRLTGRPDRGATIAFLLAPGVKTEVDGMRATIRKCGTLVHMTSSSPIAIEDAVWWPDMGHEMATSRLRVRLAAGSQEAVTTFAVISEDAIATGSSAMGTR
jgi:uncharacterized heparinase superfamily protein